MTPLTILAFTVGPNLVTVILPVNMVLTPDAVVACLGLPFIAWLLIAGILFYISRIFSGTGTYTEILRNSGYGCFPLTIISAVGIFNGIIVSRQFEIPSYVLTTAVLGLGMVSIVFVLWSGWLWSAAVKKTHALPVCRAYIPAAFATLAYVCPVLLNVAQMLPVG